MMVDQHRRRYVPRQKQTISFALQLHWDLMRVRSFRSYRVRFSRVWFRLSHRKPECHVIRYQPLAEDFLLFVGHFEKLRTGPQQTLGTPQHEKSCRIQCVVKNWDDPLLQGLAQVNHYVTATDYIHSGKRGIIAYVLRGKNAEIPDGLSDLIPPVCFVKEAAEPYRSYICLDVFLVDS